MHEPHEPHDSHDTMSGARDSCDGAGMSESALQDWRQAALGLEDRLNTVVIGQPDVVRLLLIAVFARGHVLLEGDVGVGKTTLLRALARGLGGAYERVEGTIDLMPADVLYYTYLTEAGEPRVSPGPLLRHGEDLSVFFFNEINRARPHVHSLMLRVMAERSVSAFNTQYYFPHLLVFADRNRVERDETFEIPAAARDRFLMEVGMEMPAAPAVRRALLTDVRFHDMDAQVESIEPGMIDYQRLNALAGQIQAGVQSSHALEQYALDLCMATREPVDYGVRLDEVEIRGLVEAGVSPRGMSMLMRSARVTAWLDGRDRVLPHDLQMVYRPCVAHRLFLAPVYELRRRELVSGLTDAILHTVSAP